MHCDLYTGRTDPEGTPVEVILNLRRDSGGVAYLRGEIQLITESFFGKFDCTVDGHGILRFIRDLEELQLKYPAGPRATLVDADNTLLLQITPTRMRRGRVLVSGKWQPLGSALTVTPERRSRKAEAEARAGMWLVFQGVEMEPAALPGLISRFRRLLEESGVSVQDPCDPEGRR